jgi:hypothetical protein
MSDFIRPIRPKQRNMSIFDKKYIMKHLLILFAFTLLSCGAKTLNKEEKKTDSTSTNSQVLKQEIKTNSEQKTTTEQTTNSSKTSADKSKELGFEAEPIDPTKQSSVTDKNGVVTTFTNARIKTKTLYKDVLIKDTLSEQKVSELTAKLEQSESLLFEKDNEIKLLKKELDKSKTQEQYSIFKETWFWLILLLLLLIGYLAYRKYKGTLKFPLL